MLMCNRKTVINIMLCLLNTTVVDPRFFKHDVQIGQYSLQNIFSVYQAEKTSENILTILLKIPD